MLPERWWVGLQRYLFCIAATWHAAYSAYTQRNDWSLGACD